MFCYQNPVNGGVDIMGILNSNKKYSEKTFQVNSKNFKSAIVDIQINKQYANECLICLKRIYDKLDFGFPKNTTNEDMEKIDYAINNILEELKKVAAIENQVCKYAQLLEGAAEVRVLGDSNKLDENICNKIKIIKIDMDIEEIFDKVSKIRSEMTELVDNARSCDDAYFSKIDIIYNSLEHRLRCEEAFLNILKQQRNDLIKIVKMSEFRQ